LQPIHVRGYPLLEVSWRLGVSSHSLYKWLGLFAEPASKLDSIDHEAERRRLFPAGALRHDLRDQRDWANADETDHPRTNGQVDSSSIWSTECRDWTPTAQWRGDRMVALLATSADC